MALADTNATGAEITGRTGGAALPNTPFLMLVPCTSNLTGDSNVGTCSLWCSSKSRATHCLWCKCAVCSICLRPGTISNLSTNVLRETAITPSRNGNGGSGLASSSSGPSRNASRLSLLSSDPHMSARVLPAPLLLPFPLPRHPRKGVAGVIGVTLALTFSGLAAPLLGLLLLRHLAPRHFEALLTWTRLGAVLDHLYPFRRGPAGRGGSYSITVNLGSGGEESGEEGEGDALSDELEEIGEANGETRRGMLPSYVADLD
eukprot:CAMPEP_0119314320 /NCGR_PEP_ID=MMETSP1333-20130426/32419_1 /TAXON_ID=418940 /ORGANISM="Scyphosphaera apsteinii, Strain RCC1455" /LENGTH=259 /DNA_ID=CAMNT_0007319409 /DNA_START=129 /DNA_END=908 /DNA_ORIENTATION=+